uniref:Mutator-like transposase domain-containing protein n=1 Tax=Timema poppense TaxID=170557 RepID=A0A7R9HG64_TIMPO|nr:unnamed protein product [Timema poppensis]
MFHRIIERFMKIGTNRTLSKPTYSRDVSRDEWQDRNVSPHPGPSGLHNKMNQSPTSLSNLNVSGIQELPDSDQEYWAGIPITRDPIIKEMNELLSGRRVHRKESKEHKGYENNQGTSTGMEQAILVQGFRESGDKMHNLCYKYIVSDGNSRTYAKIQRNVTYERQVIKLECASHIVRNYTDKFNKIIKYTVHDITAHKELSQLIPRLTKGARAVITDAGDNVSKNDVLRDDLRNGPYHVFGQHLNCRSTYCK